MTRRIPRVQGMDGRRLPYADEEDANRTTPVTPVTPAAPTPRDPRPAQDAPPPANNRISELNGRLLQAAAAEGNSFDNVQNFMFALRDTDFRDLMKHNNIDHRNEDALAILHDNLKNRILGVTVPSDILLDLNDSPGRVPQQNWDAFDNQMLNELGGMRGMYSDPQDFADQFDVLFNQLAPHEKVHLFELFGVDPQKLNALYDLADKVFEAAAPPPSGEPGTVPSIPPAASEAAPQTTEGAPIPQTANEERQYLATAPIQDVKNLGGGVNDTKRVTFADGSHGVFKSREGESRNLREGIQSGTYYRREVASSMVASILGFDDLVPPTNFRTINGSQGSMQRYRPNADNAAFFSALQRFDGDTDAIRSAVYDYIVGHSDRHTGNWMLDRDSQKITLIDNGLSFPHYYDPRDFFHVGFWSYVTNKGLTIPDMSRILEKWPQVERALRGCGLEDQAIELTQERMKEVARMSGKKFGSLPMFFTRERKPFFRR